MSDLFRVAQQHTYHANTVPLRTEKEVLEAIYYSNMAMLSYMSLIAEKMYEDE